MYFLQYFMYVLYCQCYCTFLNLFLFCEEVATYINSSYLPAHNPFSHANVISCTTKCLYSNWTTEKVFSSSCFERQDFSFECLSSMIWVVGSLTPQEKFSLILQRLLSPLFTGGETLTAHKYSTTIPLQKTLN